MMLLPVRAIYLVSVPDLQSQNAKKYQHEWSEEKIVDDLHRPEGQADLILHAPVGGEHRRPFVVAKFFFKSLLRVSELLESQNTHWDKDRSNPI